MSGKSSNSSKSSSSAGAGADSNTINIDGLSSDEIDTTTSVGISIDVTRLADLKKRMKILRKDKNLKELNQIVSALNVEIGKAKDDIKKQDLLIALSDLRGVVRNYIEEIQEKKLKKEREVIVTTRVAPITAGLNEPMKHTLDLVPFTSRVKQLFEWYQNKEFKKYTAPYFPMIQSSGMGKTKLLLEFQKASRDDPKCDFECLVILCSAEENQTDEAKTYFQNCFLNTKSEQPGTAIQRDDIFRQLNKFAWTKKKMVMLFDEAQELTEGKYDGFLFRCVRWWLRIKRKKKQVVAVFTGTTSKLANFYKDYTLSNTSRDSKTDYHNDVDAKLFYDPFFSITTIGCYCMDEIKPQATTGCTFSSAAYYGRPLFAILQKKDPLVNIRLSSTDSDIEVQITSPQLYTVLKRMILSMDKSDWSRDQKALFSVLGTRVQMGMTASFTLASDLVAKGYANLVYFQPYVSDNNDNSIVHVSFMPDPVCAALAMGLMNSHWSVRLEENNNTDILVGKEPQEWSYAAMELFASGLCLPERGNAGEVLVALYMLYCGDKLRKHVDIYLRTFSVPLQSWLALLKKPNDEVTISDAARKMNMNISFIQVCRNFVRGNIWNCESSLENMFHSGVASYTFPNCPAIDMVGSIQVQIGEEISYRPLLISVKTRSSLIPSTVKEAFHSMKSHLKSVRRIQKKKEKGNEATRVNHALCLLIWIGFDREIQNDIKINEYLKDDLGEFPGNDTYRLVMVPSNDPFGVSNAIASTTEAKESAEIYTSHSFLYKSPVSFTADDAFRKTSNNIDAKAFVTNFLDVSRNKPFVTDETTVVDLTTSNDVEVGNTKQADLTTLPVKTVDGHVPTKPKRNATDTTTVEAVTGDVTSKRCTTSIAHSKQTKTVPTKPKQSAADTASVETVAGEKTSEHSSKHSKQTKIVATNLKQSRTSTGSVETIAGKRNKRKRSDMK